MNKTICRRHQSFYEQGQGLMEYLILVMVIGLVTLAMAKSFGSILKNKFQIAKDKIEREVVIGDR